MYSSRELYFFFFSNLFARLRRPISSIYTVFFFSLRYRSSVSFSSLFLSKERKDAGGVKVMRAPRSFKRENRVESSQPPARCSSISNSPRTDSIDVFLFVDFAAGMYYISAPL